jgi:hypothetical protein
MRVTARASITIELPIQGNWGTNWTVSQVHADATILAKKRVEELCQCYVRLVSEPVISVITVEDGK